MLVKNDLEFILKQIKIAENHVDTNYTEYVDAQGNAIGTLVPAGLRTVSGEYNNLLNPEAGSADQIMPRLLNPIFDPAGDNPFIPGIQTTSYAQSSGSVFDAQPRIISNLVADQSLNNRAAILAALTAVGVQNPQAALAAIVAARDAAASTAASLAGAQAAHDAAYQAALDAAGTLQQAVQDALAAFNQATEDYNAANTDVEAKQNELNSAEATLALLEQRNLEIADTLRPGAEQAEADALSALDAAQLAFDTDPSPDNQALLDAANTAYEAAGAALLALNDEYDVNETALIPAAQDVVTDAQALLTGAEQARDAALAAQQQAQSDLVAAQDAADTPTPELIAAQQTLTDAQTADANAQSHLQDTLDSFGVTVDNGALVIPNVATDAGQSAPFNGFMTLFGQFFDHGLDLIPKAGSGKVYIPLQPDDPLYVEGSPTNFMVLTRTTNQPGPDGQLGTADDVHEHVNKTTPFIDLNQVYTSHESHQVFLREYVLNDEGRPVATGRMLAGEHGGPPTWADIKEQARTMLGIELSDTDVVRVPLLATDLYGNFIPGENGYAQIVTQAGLIEGNPAAPVAAGDAIATGHAFLEDIAHAAVPGTVDHDRNPGTPEIALAPDADSEAGNAIPLNAFGQATTYDNELLDAHFIVGDGRGNENIGLTAVHHVFHSEHNHRIDQIKDVLLSSGDVDFLNEWLLTDVTEIPADAGTLQWDGERLFQAARFSTEMVYQHLVFEEFVRTISPTIDPFVFSNTVDIDPAIVAEFAHVVYRFGHSMLTETVDRLSADGQTSDPIGLIEAFLNPLEFVASGADSEEAAGAILRGMSRQVGNEIDEFTTGALRNNLVGLPLDLPALNIARARETGVPSLNEARAQFFEQTGDSTLQPYGSWFDFAVELKHPASVINFIAAYGTHETIVNATTLEAKRDAATLLVMGGAGAPEDRLDFLNAEGAYAGGALGGLNDVDFWIGGLAEKRMPFGGMLGSTFNFVFENQMEKLQNGDRFYYLSRTQGLNLLNELEADSFAELVMRNTDLGNPDATHLPGAMFTTPAWILELDQNRQKTGLGVDGRADPTGDNPVLEAISPLVVRRDIDKDGDGDYLRYTGVDHVVLGGTEEDDTLIAGEGDDTLWGDGGNDRLEGGMGNDHLSGGDGDDVITDAGSDLGDVIHGDGGNDVINGGNGVDLIFGGEGQDFIYGGTDSKNVSGGLGNDFIAGPSGASVLAGNEGDDWIEGGDGFDTLTGENSQLFFNSDIIGHDVLNGRGNDNDYDAESGDDIMFQGPGVQRNNGMAGFDWAIHKGDPNGADSDLGIPIFVNQQANILRDRFDLMEGLSGWTGNDRLTGREDLLGAFGAGGAAAQFDPTSPFASYSNALTEEGVARIDGLGDLVAHLDRATFTVAGETVTAVVFDDTAVQRDAAGNALTMFDTPSDILLGGGGDDILQGKAGNDILDGDRWLNVRIRINDADGNEIATADDMRSQVRDLDGNLLYGGRTLNALMFDRTLNPGQLAIVREILDGDPDDMGIDTAVFADLMENYTVTANDDGSLTVAHTGFAQNGLLGLQLSDGVDRLFNIEQLQFADQTVEASTFLNQAPVILSDGAEATAALTVDENTTAVTQVQALDVDGPQDVVYAISGGADAGLFQIDAATGELSFIDAPDFEAPADADGDNVFEVTVEASDGALADTQELSITLANVDEAASGTVDIVSFNNTGALASLTATNNLADPDGIIGDIQYQWQRQVAGDWQNIAGATAATVTGLSNATVRATANYTDPFGTKTVASETVAVITGTAASNAVVGTAGSDLLLGLGGSDTLTGNAGNDVVDGGAGADTILATVDDGDDVYRGGAGDADTYSLANTAADATVDLGAGTASSAQTGNDTLAGIERVVGGSGNDLLISAAGIANRLAGGQGNDTYVVHDATDLVVEAAGQGTDSVSASVSFTLAANVEDLTLTGLGNLNGTGNGAANVIVGNVGNNVLSGGGGVDTLNGGDGADRLIGGTGADSLTGGAGRDTFAFSAGDSSRFGATIDQVTDYAKGAAGLGDSIDFTAALTRGGSAAGATALTASVNQTTGVATFAAGSGTTLADAVNDIALRFTLSGDANGEFALFQVNRGGNFHLYISDGVLGASANDVVVELVGVTSVSAIDLTGGDLTITA